MVLTRLNSMTETKTEMVQHLKEGKWATVRSQLQGSECAECSKTISVLHSQGMHCHRVRRRKDIDVDLYYTEVWTHVKDGWLLASRHASKN